MSFYKDKTYKRVKQYFDTFEYIDSQELVNGEEIPLPPRPKGPMPKPPLLESSKEEDSLPAFAASLLLFLDPSNAVAPSENYINPPYTFIIPLPTKLTVFSDTILVDTELVTSISGDSNLIFSFEFNFMIPFLPSAPVDISSIF